MCNLWDRPLVSRSQSPPCLALVDNKRSGPAPRSARTTKTEQRAARPREALLALGPPQLSKSASMSSLVETSTAENSSRGTKAALFLLSPPAADRALLLEIYPYPSRPGPHWAAELPLGPAARRGWGDPGDR